MDEQAVEKTLDLLQAHRLVEEVAGDVRPTKRWNAKLQAAAEKINLVAARTGVNPEGNPLVLAVTRALADENLGLADAQFDDAVRVLTVLELTRIGPDKRAQLGFGDAPLG